jgi:tetratricopeptide (TPR) repeat protein
MRFVILLLAGAAAFAQPSDPLTSAYEALRAKRYDEAISFFIKGIEQAPQRGDVRKDLAYTYLKVGEAEEARDQFGEAMRLDPADEHVALEYAFLCNETKEQGQARRIFDRLRHSQNASTRATAGQAFENIDRPLREGIDRWLQAIERGGENFSGHYELATLAERRDQLDLAARHYEAAWRMVPERRYVLIDLGRVWKALGRTEQATAALLGASRGGEPRAAEKARELLPSHFPYITEFHSALKLDPASVELRRDLAFLLLRMGRQAEAEAELKLIAGKDLLAAAQLGFIYLGRKDNAAAMPLLERVLESGDEDLANRVRAVLRRQQTGPKAAADAKIMADRSIKAGYLRDALKYLDLAHESDPVDFSVMLKLGWTYNVLHDDDQAVRWFDLARRSPEPTLAAEAERAWKNLHSSVARVRTTSWLFPMYSSRWRDLFSYGQVKTEWNPRRSCIRTSQSV